jgi:predicted ribosome-associated RNA-binding protein Tma20
VHGLLQVYLILTMFTFPIISCYPCSDPNIMKKFQVDRGAIKFVLSGANIMCPGLTSPGGALDEEVLENKPVVTSLVPSKYCIIGDFYEIIFFFKC